MLSESNEKELDLQLTFFIKYGLLGIFTYLLRLIGLSKIANNLKAYNQYILLPLHA